MTRPARLNKTNRLLAVLDTPQAAAEARLSLTGAGFEPADVASLAGADAADWIDSRGRRAGRIGRAMRLIALTQADQSVDLATYEAALRQGRAVVVVRVPDPVGRQRAVALLERAGAHFINYYGRFVTEDIAPWRGERPEVPWQYHR